MTTAGEAADRLDPRVDRTRIAVLAAARNILVNEGWDGVTQLRVAEASGVGRATIYRHWPDRATLLYDVLAAEELALHTERTGDVRADVGEHLRRFRDALVDPTFGRIVTAIVDRAEWEPAIMEIKVKLVSQSLDFLGEILQAGFVDIEVGADLDADLAAAQLLGPITFRSLVASASISDEFIDRLVDDFFRLHPS